MKIKSTIQLGSSSNLVYGFDPSWNPSSKGSSDGLYRPGKKPLIEKEIDISPHQSSTWQYPDISLHDSAESLLTALYPFKVVNPTDGTNSPDLPAGPLLLKDGDKEKAVKKLSKTIGVDLGQPDYGYALVQLRREAGQAEHPCSVGGVRVHPNPIRIPEDFGVNENFRKDFAKMRPCIDDRDQFSPEQITPKIAQGYLDFYKDYGTHFVSKVRAGDVIFQVFAFPSTRFERVKKAYEKGENPLSGPEAITFRYFTTNANTGTFGYVKEYGKILCLSGDQTLQTMMEADEWLEPKWAETNSIFAPFGDETSISLNSLNERMTEITLIDIELTALSLFAEHNRKKAWTRILKAALLQKYQEDIKPNFVRYYKDDVKSKIPNHDASGFLSTIATPTINTYRTTTDLSQLEFVASNEVNEFTLTTNVLYKEGQGEVHLPGKDVYIASQFVDLEQPTSISTILLTDEGYDSLKMTVRRFYGGCIVRNESGSKVSAIVDGIKYTFSEGGPDGRYEVKAEADMRSTPPENMLPRILNSLQFSFTFAETIINGSPARGVVRSFATNTLLWLGELIPDTSKDADLLDLRVRALDLAKVVTDPSQGTFVPLLPYADYEKQVNRILDYVKEIEDQIHLSQEQIENRKQKELIIDVAKKLNHNIIESGDLLSKIVEANAAQQKDLAAYYDAMIDQRKVEYKKQDARVNDLEQQVTEQQSEVRTAVLNYKQAVQDWETREWIKFGLDVATNVFDLGTSIAIPAKSISAVEKLGLTVQRIRKLLNILNATSKLYNSAKGSIDNIQNAQRTLDGLDEDSISSNLAWDEMNLHLSSILATGPSDPTVNKFKAELVEAFGILAMRGKAWVSAKASAREIARDIYIQQKQQKVVDEQSKRLDDLKGYLKPDKIKDLDRSAIDLVGLTGSLVFMRDKMLGILSKAFTLQDQALQYHYLQQPTTVDTFDLIGFKGALARQEANKIEAKTSLNQYQATTTTPIKVRVEGVRTEELVNGNVYRLNIQPDQAQFLEYVNLRVKALTVSVDDVLSTESGDYLVNLAYQGTPFFDRDTKRSSMIFHTPRRERTYEYDVQTNKPKFSDGGTTWAEDVNPITPFSTWEISMPKTQKNKGIRFKDQTVDLILTFVLEARIKDVPAKRSNESLVLKADNTPSESELVKTMYDQGTALNDWDVVFNMSLEEINDVIKKQYKEFKDKDKEFGGRIKVETKTEVVKGVYSVKRFDLQYGYPKLTFLANNDGNVNLEMQITSGSLTKCIQTGEDTKCDPSIEVKDETMKATVPLSKIEGTLKTKDGNKDVKSVVLNLAKGSFKPGNIELSDEEKVLFNEAVKAYFAEHKIEYIINTLDLTTIPTLDDLRPNDFRFKVYTSKSGNQMLQLFIQTNNRKPLDESQTFLNNVNEPIPQGYSTSLMINSRILFDKVMPNSMNKKEWKLKGVEDKDRNKAWHGEFYQGSIGGQVDLSKLDHEDSRTYRGGTTIWWKYHYYLPNGNRVSWSINEMDIKSSDDGKLRLHFDKGESITFYEETKTKTCTLFSCDDWDTSTQSYSTDFHVTISALFPVTVKGSDRNQQIKIDATNKAVNVSGRTSGGGPCGSDDLQAQVNKRLKEQIPEEVVKELNVDFNPVSLFAIKNLLFPNDNYINLEQVYVPGDMLILGNFTNRK